MPAINRPWFLFLGSRMLVSYQASPVVLRNECRRSIPSLLLDLARKPVFLHDNSVPTLDALFDPKGRPNAPHPFYLPDREERAEIVEFLRGTRHEVACGRQPGGAP